MLSRVADNLYWMSRYLERADHTARLLDVHLRASLSFNQLHEMMSGNLHLYLNDIQRQCGDIHSAVYET